MKKSNIIFASIVALLIFYIANRAGEMYFNSQNPNAIEKFNYVAEHIETVFDKIYIATDKNSLICGFGGVACFGIAILYFVFGKKNYMQGVEHGSAKWGTSSDIAKYKDKNYQNNILLTQTESLSMNTRQTMRNNNILVIGGSGSGKTRFFLKPNLMQMHSSYVITDPKGTVLYECGKMLADNGYKIKVFNTVDFSKSMHFNPFTFIKDEKDILVFVDILITSTRKKDEKPTDSFWENAEKMLYMALVGYIFYEYADKPEKQNFAELLELINMFEVREDDETFMNGVDYMFEELEIGTEAFNAKYDGQFEKITERINPPRPKHFALLQYKKFKLSAGKTAKSILVSAGTRLAPFDIKQVRDLTMYDEMELGKIGEEKTALFIIIDDKISTFNFLAGLMYSQLFKELCDKADNKYGGRLPIHVRCMLDEFANIGQIPEFEKLIATIRSREISVDVIVQNMAQIEGLYDKQAGTIVGNCDSTLFLGSGEEKTTENISKRVGKTTIDHRGSSTTKGIQGSYSLQDQILGRDLITADEVGRLDNTDCILFIRGLKPFKSKKYDITLHPNYKKSSDKNKENIFNLDEYFKKLVEERLRKQKEKEKQENDDFEKEFNSFFENAEFIDDWDTAVS